MRCLVIGGTRFFGKCLVQDLLDKGRDVTILTRGIADDSFGDQITRLTADRGDAASIKSAIGNLTWDVAYDQIGYSPNGAKLLCDALSGKIARLKLALSARAYDKIRRVARTIADLAGEVEVNAVFLAEALQYRTLGSQ